MTHGWVCAASPRSCPIARLTQLGVSPARTHPLALTGKWPLYTRARSAAPGGARERGGGCGEARRGLGPHEMGRLPGCTRAKRGVQSTEGRGAGVKGRERERAEQGYLSNARGGARGGAGRAAAPHARPAANGSGRVHQVGHAARPPRGWPRSVFHRRRPGEARRPGGQGRRARGAARPPGRAARRQDA
ncbi:MAG: hypothetical protein J3K34DRAFT_131489 [Monoraphidium minutum]|nr:MAG: hypothetical protein J3K34DRAFT_131489 [Monoraphidium minutum]